MLIRTIVALAVVFWGSEVAAEAKFVIPEKDCPPAICGTARSIYIEGPIGANDAARLETKILEEGVSIYSNVYLNSPGGSLFGGMELGRLFRKYGFNTSVGKLLANGEHSSEGSFCYSSCTLAFLGGHFRYVSEDTLYGVHRFYSEQPAEDAEAMAQVASAAIISYLSEMDVPSGFFVEMTKAGSDSLQMLSFNQMLELGVANNGVGTTEWTLNASDASTGSSYLYLKGERDTSFGINKLMFLCPDPKRGMIMHVIFDPQGRTDEVQMMRAISIKIDQNQYPFADYLIEEPKIVNGWINAFFSVPGEYWSEIKNGKEMGVFFQFTYEAPVFLGFRSMPLNKGKNMMAGIESSCPNLYSKPTASSYRRFKDTDFLGADLTKKGFKDISIERCEALCSGSDQCKTYSYVQSSRWCFPKYGVEKQIHAPGIVSGVKQ